MLTRDFFRFGSKLVSSTFQASPFGLKDDENGLSEHLDLIKGKYIGINFPVIYKQDQGKKLTDLLDTGFVSLFLISDKMKTVLEENNLTGWKSYPIKLYDKKDNEIFGYHGFSITGQCAPINYKKAEIIEKRRVPNGPICKFYKGAQIDINKWDGKDFFLPDKTIGILITSKVADLLITNNITNVCLENLADEEMSVSNIKI